ncbi:MAG TPA: ATP synthase F1 subunit epsilon [Allosphingosinicella sp.]|nr:ATP synthase F1 subunit epsilon [Allosphingosinicella sp.]
MADLHFELVTPERLVRSESVYMVVVPGTEGDFGVLAGHAPYMSTLRNGDLAIYRASMNETPELIPVEGGFAEVNEKGLTVLAEKAEAEARDATRAAAPRMPEGVGPA